MPKVSEDYKEKRRFEILEVAERVFLEKGFAGVTMTDIVTATGLSRGGLYHYFSNTDEVYQAILSENEKEAAKYFISLGTDYGTIWGGIQAYLKEVQASLKHPENDLSPVNIEYFIIGRREEGRTEFINRRYETGIGYFTELLDKGVKGGEFNPIQPLRTIAIFLLNSIDALHVSALIMEYETINISGQIEAIQIYLKSALGITNT